MPRLFSHDDVLHYVPLAGSERHLLHGSRSAGPADPDEAMSVTVQVRSRASQDALDAAFDDIADTPLERRQYLSHAELAEQFGADPDDLDAVEEFAHHFNLVVLDRNPNKQTVILGGRTKDFSRAFRVTLHRYHSEAGTYRGRTGPVCVPQQLDGIVTNVFGLDNRPKRRSRYHAYEYDALDAEPHAGTLPNGLFSGADFADRYHFPTMAHGANLDGAGQTVGIVELGGGFLTNDLVAYFQRINLPTPNVTAVSVDHGGNHPDPGQNSADGEVMLDIEVVGAVVPAARQVVYFAPNTNNGFFDAMAAAILDSQRKPSVVSISWGAPEDGETTATLLAQSNLFKKAALLGVTVCVASGDHGSIDIDPDSQPEAFQQNHGRLHVDSPSCFAGVLSCGGTMITQQGETTWNENNGWAGGGGVSTKVARPSYQSNANVPASTTGFHGRGVPDVSGSATRYFVRVRGSFGGSGGTSAVAPLWAGLIARLNQAKGGRAGFINPVLYAHPNVMTDIATGNNDITQTNPPHFAAKQGWDAATGLGVPNGMAILEVL